MDVCIKTLYYLQSWGISSRLPVKCFAHVALKTFYYMARLFILKLEHSQRLPVSNNIWYKKSPLGKSGSHFWKLLKIIPFTELVFQSSSIQTYMRLCSWGKCYQNVKSLEINTNQHLFNFREECWLHLVAQQMSLQQASSPYIFCSYKSERTKTICCCKKWTVGKCIFQGANFENCSFKSNCSVTEVALERKPGHAGLKSFTGFSVQIM